LIQTTGLGLHFSDLLKKNMAPESTTNRKRKRENLAWEIAALEAKVRHFNWRTGTYDKGGVEADFTLRYARA
jgi:hypothetical protein